MSARNSVRDRPITAKTAEELGLRVDVVASEYTVEGLVRALKTSSKASE